MNNNIENLLCNMQKDFANFKSMYDARIETQNKNIDTIQENMSNILKEHYRPQGEVVLAKEKEERDFYKKDFGHYLLTGNRLEGDFQKSFPNKMPSPSYFSLTSLPDVEDSICPLIKLADVNITEHIYAECYSSANDNGDSFGAGNVLTIESKKYPLNRMQTCVVLDRAYHQSSESQLIEIFPTLVANNIYAQINKSLFRDGDGVSDVKPATLLDIAGGQKKQAKYAPKDPSTFLLEIISAINHIPSFLRQNEAWIVSPEAAIILQSVVVGHQPLWHYDTHGSMFMGKPVHINSAIGGKVCFYGNFKKGYSFAIQNYYETDLDDNSMRPKRKAYSNLRIGGTFADERAIVCLTIQ